MKKETGQQKTKLKEITINELAVMVQKGFADVDRRFDAIDRRFEAIDQRSEASDKRAEGLEYEIAMIKQTMATKDDIRDLDAHIGRFERRFQKIEEIVLDDH